MKYDLILLSAGKSRRMKFAKKFNKVLLEINNKKIIEYSIDRFLDDKDLNKIILVIQQEEKNIFESIIKKYKEKILICYGGEFRSYSVFNALRYVNKKISYIIIHDAARPLFSFFDIANIKKYIKFYNGVILAEKVKDTIKYSNNDIVIKTINRNNIWLSKTPQMFKLDKLKEIYTKKKYNMSKITDESVLFEKYFKNSEIKIVEELKKNIKLTDYRDLELIKYLLINDDIKL